MIISTAGLVKLRSKTIMVDGCFDPLHYGHIAYFKFAAGFGLPVLCNVETDRYVKEVKKRPPLLPEAQRIQVIDAIKYITYTHLQNTTTVDVLRQLQPLKYIKGTDWKNKLLPEDELETSKKYGIEIVYTDKNLDSSTALIKRFIRYLRARSRRYVGVTAICGTFTIEKMYKLFWSAP